MKSNDYQKSPCRSETQTTHILELIYTKALRDQRRCKICKCLEDESNFFFNCDTNKNLKSNIFKYFT